MSEVTFWPKLVLAILATWRLTHMVAREDGPADLVSRARTALRNGLWGRMVTCFQCLSVWVAAPAALWITTRPLDAVIVWLAVSGGACLCDRIGQPDVFVQPLPESNQGEDNGMLRAKE